MNQGNQKDPEGKEDLDGSLRSPTASPSQKSEFLSVPDDYWAEPVISVDVNWRHVKALNLAARMIEATAPKGSDFEAWQFIARVAKEATIQERHASRTFPFRKRAIDAARTHAPEVSA